MKVIIAGSRHVTNVLHVETAAWLAQERRGIEITQVVSGCAQGVDTLGIEYAEARKIPVKRFAANFARYGKDAGILRNEEMANYADALIAVWDGISAGTRDMIFRAKQHGLEVFVYRVIKPKFKSNPLIEGA